MSRGDGFKPGTGDSPLFKLTLEQTTVIRTSLGKLPRLWPGILFALSGGASAALSTQAEVMTFGGLAGDAPAGMVAAIQILRLLALFFGLWFAAKLIRFYLFRPAVVVETGIADEEKIDSVLKGRFPKSALSMTYAYMLLLVVVAFGVP